MDFKYKTTFNFPIKTVYAKEEQGNFLSLASLKEISSLAPDVEHIEGNYDLLYNVFNAAVINRINKNYDGLDGATALAVYKKFIHKPMNIEHNRNLVVGHIINAGFAEYGSNRILTEDEVRGNNNPFYLSLGAVVYKLTDPVLASLLIEASDETSPHYQAIATSWELGFNSYNILLGNKDLSQGELITDEKQVQAFSKYLKAYGGIGNLEDGTPVYRMITGNVLPLGCGYTTTPAAEVIGVNVIQPNKFTIIDEGKDKEQNPIIIDTENVVDEPDQLAAVSVIDENTPKIQENEQNNENNKNISSQQENNNVNQNRIMKIEDISDANVRVFLADEINKVSNEYGAKLDQVKNDLSLKETEANTFKEDLARVQAEFERVKQELDAEKQVRANDKIVSDFNVRSAEINEKYNLSDKDREVVAKQIRGLSDEDYQSWYSDFQVVAEHKSKSFKPAAQANASAEDVLDNLTPSDQPSPVNPAPKLTDLKSVYAEHFKVEDFLSTSR